MDISKREEIGVWLDACLDMPHFGHANALRQARLFGDRLVLGIHSDEEIVRNKGQPVYNTQERLRLARAMRWVDEVVEDVPYLTSLDLMDKNGCQLCVHGDDIATTADGTDSYRAVKEAGRFCVFHRTLGISTTNLIGRLLRAAGIFPTQDEPKVGAELLSDNYFSAGMIVQFYGKRRERRDDDKVVYVAGAFDLFHVGHLAFLEAAKAQGTYLVVGIHDNDTVKANKGFGRPFLSLYERALGILAYRCVDEVIIGAPYKVTTNLLDTYDVKMVCHGRKATNTVLIGHDGTDPYVEPKRRGIFKMLESDTPNVTTESLLQRIAASADKYCERNRKCEAKESKMMLQKKLSNVENFAQSA